MSRQKSFSLDAALDTLTELFLKRGYAALSMRDIGDAIGVTRSTIYKTFGNKSELFATLLQRYGPARGPGLRELCNAPSPRAALVRVFEIAGVAVPRCLLLDTIVTVPDSSPEVTGLIEAAVEDLQERFGAAIKRGQVAGEIATGVGPAEAAGVLLTLYLGRYVRVHSCVARESVLAAVARQAQALLPPPS